MVPAVMRKLKNTKPCRTKFCLRHNLFKIIRSFRSREDQSKNEIEPYIGAVTVTCKAGLNISLAGYSGIQYIRFDEKGARALGFGGALAALNQRNVSRTMMNIER